jgi:hypothetical protein
VGIGAIRVYRGIGAPRPGDNAGRPGAFGGGLASIAGTGGLR